MDGPAADDNGFVSASLSLPCRLLGRLWNASWIAPIPSPASGNTWALTSSTHD